MRVSLHPHPPGSFPFLKYITSVPLSPSLSEFWMTPLSLPLSGYPPPFFYIHSQAISLFLKVWTKFHPISDSDITLPSNLKHVCPKAKLSSIITLTHPPPRDAASFSPLHRPQTIHLYTSQPWTINTILNAKLVTKCNRLPHNISSKSFFLFHPFNQCFIEWPLNIAQSMQIVLTYRKI